MEQITEYKLKVLDEDGFFNLIRTLPGKKGLSSSPPPPPPAPSSVERRTSTAVPSGPPRPAAKVAVCSVDEEDEAQPAQQLQVPESAKGGVSPT